MLQSILKIDEVAEKIRQVIQQEPFVWGEKKFSVTASIGIVEIDGSVLSHTELMRMADVACFTAKDLGRNRIHAYSEQDEELSKRDAQIRWVPKLNDALENDRIVLYAHEGSIGATGATGPVYPFGGTLRHHAEDR